MLQGCANGAPVRLSGVDIGNVTSIHIVPDKDKHLTPVEVTMKVSTKYSYALRRDSVTSLDTAGVLGETYLDIDSAQAVGPPAQDGDTLPTEVHPDFNQVVRASQSTLENMDALLKRADRILAFAESGKGSLGKLIYDPTLYNRFSATVADFQKIVDQVGSGQGSLGALISRNDAYDKFLATLDKMNGVIDDIQQGKGTAGKFVKDPSLYNNANDTIANIKKLTEDINAGKGTIGKLDQRRRTGQEARHHHHQTLGTHHRTRSRPGHRRQALQRRFPLQQRERHADRSANLVKAVRENPKKYLSIKLHIF